MNESFRSMVRLTRLVFIKSLVASLASGGEMASFLASEFLTEAGEGFCLPFWTKRA